MYASVASMIQQFNMDNIRILLSMGYEVHVACNMKEGSTIPQEKVLLLQQELNVMGVKTYHIPIPRKVTALNSIRESYKITKKLLDEQKYTLVHCHSPIGSIICRLAHRSSKNYRTTRMIYTAHGFHFFKGGPLTSWLLFYPIEKFLSRYTDILITINIEDYSLAQKKFKARQVIKVPGVGVNTAQYRDVSVDRCKLRGELGLNNEDILILSVGELSDRKNHSVIIRALHQLQNSHVHYAIVGKGSMAVQLEKLIQDLNMQKQVTLLGFRSDIPNLCRASDIFAFPSKREGLGLAAIEAMAAGLPIITSNINGINDYSIDGVTGYSCAPTDVETFATSIQKCITNPIWLEEVGKENIERAQKYDISNVNKIMQKIYEV